jgi:rhodanese-related sulfurtransferase
MMAFSNNDDADFLKLIATSIQEQMRLRTFLFAVATTGPTKDSATNYIAVCGSMNDFVHRAVLLASAKFMSRIDSVYSEDKLWIAGVKDYGSSSFDEIALWDVVKKAARQPIDPLRPPPGSKGIDEILEETRAKLQRLTPQQAYRELQEPTVGAPTFLVDIRPAAQRAVEGSIYGSLIIERNVLEWRFDPRCSAKLNIADRYDLRIIIICQEGYTSSLAAYSLHQIGMLNATDVSVCYSVRTLIKLNRTP